MMEEEKKFKSWIKDHRNNIIWVGVGTVTSAVLVYFALQKREKILELLKSNGKTDLQCVESFDDKLFAPVQMEILETRDSQRVHEVEKHIRNLPEGYYASLDKKVSAADHGFELSENQTWVEDYTKRHFVA